MRGCEFRERVMRKPVGDAVFMISVFLIGTGLVFALAYSVGLLPRRLDTMWTGAWIVLTWLTASEIVLLGLNVWAIKRGEFRWCREGVVTAIILIILCLIIFPTLTVVHSE
jgi:uncharacterized membrane protein YozB (DUF420 family)